MIDDRDYMRETRRQPQWSATIAILVVNIVIFGLQIVAERFFPDFEYERYFALSLNGLLHGYVWQLLTYQFLHGGFWHIFLNSWAIYVFGRVVEASLGMRRMLTLYFISGIAGGLVQMLGVLVWPGHIGGPMEPVVGASAGAYGLVAAAAALFPDQLLYLLVFFVIPIKMRTRTLLWLSIAMSVAGIIVPYGHIGHAAHLGGLITGLMIARQWSRSRVPPIISGAGTKSSLKITHAQE